MTELPDFTVAALAAIAFLVALAFIAWRRYLWASAGDPALPVDDCPYGLTDAFGDHHLVNAPHQAGVRWLTDVFARSARRFPDLTALQVPATGESLTFAELDAQATRVAAALSPHLTGADQVVAVAMPQDDWHIVAAHLGVLRAGAAVMFLDSTLPEALTGHMLDDARPVIVITRGQDRFRDLPTLDVLALPETTPGWKPPGWLDDPAQRLAAIFYTSGTTGLPKGVECAHAGYVNLALSYADYFDLVPGVDATSLTSSMGYDGSISEMYSAWVSGCAVVLLTREQTRSGPDLVSILREAEVTVLFGPPVLLTTLSQAPERDLPWPLCRYIVPAGEAFPGALVERWTRGRRQIINTYGPTEASTDTSRQSLRPGEPVTIGSPFPNVSYLILEIDGLNPLPHGKAGELCIGGVQLARGYRNLPEQTAEKFITHPRFGRLYRSGDRCRIDIRTQQVQFLGRIDSQLKVRGHRVEAQAVEDILQTQFREVESAVLSYQNEELVAFVVAPSVSRTEDPEPVPAPRDWAERVTQGLSRQLPPPSVPDRIFLVDTLVMNPVSGKIDRERLPELASRLPGARSISAGAQMAAPPDTEVVRKGNGPEPGSEEVLDICRAVFEAPLGWDDVFADHGGHSIIIARLAQRLHAAGRAVSVRALLGDCNTARKVAACAKQRPPVVERRESGKTGNAGAGRDEAAAKALPVGLFTALQLLFLALLYAPPLTGFLAAVAFAEIGDFFMTAALWEFIAVGFLLYLIGLIFPFAGLLWVMLIKVLMGGHVYRNRVTPGSYPRWSRMHLRVWCIGRLQNFVLRPLGAMFRSAPLMAYALRRLGATVGANLQCAHDAEFSGPLDLLTIGNDVAIQTGAYVSLAQWSGSGLHVGPVRLEQECKIGMRAAVANNATVGRGSWIQPFTPVVGDIGVGEMWEGAPARFAGCCVPLTRAANASRVRSPPWLLEASNILMQTFFDFWLIVLPTAALAWFTADFIPDGGPLIAGDYFKATPIGVVILHMGLYTFLTTWIAVVLVSVVVCLFLRLTRMPPGLYATRGFRGALLLYRMKKMNQVQGWWTWTITGQYLRALAGMRFPRLGASECDLMFNLVPELARADSQVFWSNGCFTNMLDYGARHITLRPVDMPENFFSGNNSVAEAGQFPSNFLLGVSTPANDLRFRRQMRTRPGEPVTVAGNPPVRFASADFAAENDSRKPPGFFLFLARLFLNDFLAMGFLGMADLLLYIAAFTSLLRAGLHPLASAFLALVLAEAALVLLSLGVKWLLVGKTWGSGHETPFWSWRHFSYFFAQDCFFAWCKRPLETLAGTLLPNIVLRRMGCRIGKRTILASPLQASDWNAVRIGDDCMVNGILQFHTFENMTLRVMQAEIRDGTTIGFGATVMGGAVIERGAMLQPLSLVLKEMHLAAASYGGSPAEILESEHGNR